MVKLTASWAGLGLLLGLSACANDTTTQTDLRKAGYDVIEAYNVAAPLATAYEGSTLASKTVSAQIKKDSTTAISAINTLGADLQSSNPVTALEVSAATAAVAALQSDVAGASK